MTSTHQANILLVDDQPARLLTYEAILADLGQNLVKAGSGREALQQLMDMEFAAILLDVSMPEMDGFETASLIREHPRFESTPIIFVTGVHVTDLDQLRAYQIGAVDYVYVPVVPEILRGKVQVLVELNLQRRELRRLNASLQSTNAQLTLAHEQLKADNNRTLHELNQTLAKANSELERSNLALMSEINERERAQKELQAQARRKDEFLATLAHELRNPLSAIHNGVQLMHARPLTDPQLLWTRDLLGRQVKHLTRLIDDLLDVARITSGRIQLHQEKLDLGALVQRAVETLQPTIDARRHTLALNVHHTPLFVSGDGVRLTQVLDNLLSNAARYTDEGGQIHVDVVPDPSTPLEAALIRVRDNGIGIPPAMLEEVFDLFTQANPSFARTQGGLGIGLALVRGLVRMHGGEVMAVSEGVGKGAEFVVRLPLATVAGDISLPTAVDGLTLAHSEGVAFEAHSVQESTPVPTSLPAAVSAGLHLLLIDDNKDSADSLAQWLQARGHTVSIENAGDSGLARALAQRPQVVLLDIGLPGLSGYEVAQKLRADNSFSCVPLVAMTGFGGVTDRNRAQQCGFDHYLVKPVDYDQLNLILEACTAAHHAQLNDISVMNSNRQEKNKKLKAKISALGM